jgi:Plavaka transposase
MHPPLNNHIQILPAWLPSSPPPDDMDFDNGENDPGPHEAIQGGVQMLRHPILTGMLFKFIHKFSFNFQQSSLLGIPCDSLGNYLPPDTLPPPAPYDLPGEDGAAHNDWDPFHSRAQFEIADFLYRRNQMPGAQVDVLFDLWAASGEDEPPFSSHNDLYDTIDSIKLGDLPWLCFTVKYNGPLPIGAEVPTWMMTEHEVWCRDVRLLMNNQLANPDFNGEIDYSPLQIFGPTGKREWSNVMTGNWAWKQAVSYFDV